jgi:alpha-glucosidase
MLLLTLRGTPVIYSGEEIGMHDVVVPPERSEDPQGKTQPTRTRDVARTPMQWNDGPNAGFTTGKPLFPVADDYVQINVAAEERDPRSLLALYRRLIGLRKTQLALTVGLQTPVVCRPPLLYFCRELSDRGLAVVLNMGTDELSFDFGEIGQKAVRLLLSTYLDRVDERPEKEVRLRSNEGLILAFEQSGHSIF